MAGVTMQPVDPALHSDRAGAALLEGWSDSEARRIVFAWPEETRTLPWSAAGDWKQFVSSLENEILGEETGCWVGFISYEALATEEDVAPRDAHRPEPAAFFALHL